MTNDEKLIIINKIKSLAAELCDDKPDKEWKILAFSKEIVKLCDIILEDKNG